MLWCKAANVRPTRDLIICLYKAGRGSDGVAGGQGVEPGGMHVPASRVAGLPAVPRGRGLDVCCPLCRGVIPGVANMPQHIDRCVAAFLSQPSITRADRRFMLYLALSEALWPARLITPLAKVHCFQLLPFE